MQSKQGPQSLYEERFEHDACGVGFIANIDGSRDHKTIADALKALACLKHRGATDADEKTGDGVGVQFEVPDGFFRAEFERLSGHAPGEGPIAVGMVFLRPDDADRARGIVDYVLRDRGFEFVWRDVPIEPEVLGRKATDTLPVIQQVIVSSEAGTDRLDLDRKLYAARKEADTRARTQGVSEPYFASFSCRRMVYKGLMLANSVSDFYPDLERENFESAYCLFHQRYSTNTFPAWPLAQPFDMLGHNGEINTLLGNLNGTRLREADLESPIWGDDLEYIKPILDKDQSDSAQLDNVLELLTLSGRSVVHSMMMLVPEAWEAMPDVDPGLKAFFEYHACINEPWDGPAALIFSDGDFVGAKLDRNGLRPARYKVTADGRVMLGSEVGVLDLEPEDVVEQGRLGPGEMIAIDLKAGELLRHADIQRGLAERQPYGDWVDQYMTHLEYAPFERVRIDQRDFTESSLTEQQLCFGYSAEETKYLFEPMAVEGKDPVLSMGDDTPIAVLSRLPRLLCTYFKQRFAQVTNPPIDPIRESLVMSLNVNLGRRRNWLAETPEHADQLVLAGPIITSGDLANVEKHAKTVRVPAFFDRESGQAGMEPAIKDLCERAEKAVDEGASVIVLSDRGANAGQVPIPMLLAVGAVNNHLLRRLKRLQTSIIVESGEPREVHHFATLIGFGASAVNPYLAFQTISTQLADDDTTDDELADMLENYRQAIHKGLLKIMSKMGISVLGSYRGAQIFEAIGIGEKVIEECFTNTPSQIGGLGYEDIAREALIRHDQAFPQDEDEDHTPKVDDLGYFRFRRGGEQHGWSPKMLRAIQGFRRERTWDNFKNFIEEAENHPPISVRDLLEFQSDRGPISLDEVESIEEIRKRFTTAAMSLGSLSPEVHEAIAVAMNRIGGKSNTGEGGEDPKRFTPRDSGESANAYIKQVASGRFGVTPQYLSEAAELEIKMAQGSKPGEGGQLPGHKVTKYIATLRHSTPGVSLISPPPHHDIYSIEDLAQLIYDLKQINPEAEIVVKLVAEAGVGTIAAGVAKAYADVIQISGHDGGTGASPLSSIKNAGSPWELGLAETQQVLRLNNLRDRVKLRTDGGLKTGRDIVLAAILGAEEYNFGTAALIAIGCKYVRQCHLDTCPVGIATQREELRERFSGSPEDVIEYFNGVAEDVRRWLAELGYRSVEEIVGRTDLLRQRRIDDHPKAHTVDLFRLLADPAAPDAPRRRTWERNVTPDPSMNDRLIDDCRPAIDEEEELTLSYDISNVDRTVGARVAGAIAKKHGNEGLAEGTLELTFEGSAGQSFGAFNIGGMSLTLLGEANDYLGKGMAGGRIVLKPRAGSPERAEDVVVGNTVLYGATGGEVFIKGSAGERFGVRNSGCQTVVEGVGDHCCEYMTQGTVVVLGRTGKNFGAGMTGGLAFVYDPDGSFVGKYNSEFVRVERADGAEEVEQLERLVREHARETGSRTAKNLLNRWDEASSDFWMVTPWEILKLRERDQEAEARAEDDEISA
jgi:glutamate synthase (NADPH/NADH) large chain/glutamate synthase (ferredoxin)